MIQKRAILFLICLFACLDRVSTDAQSSNVVETPAMSAQPGEEKFSQLGDPAPPLTVQEWIKGKPVKIRPAPNFSAIVFCTLTKANQMALTNLSALQSLYQDKGLITVIISGEAPDTLRSFVQARGADINFTVAADDYAGKTTTDYQRTFNDRQLPRAFVVGKDGNVLWHGHPLRDDLGEVVDKIANGRYDLAQAKKDVQTRLMTEAYLRMARQDDPRTAKAGRIMLIVRTNDAPALCDLAFQIGADPYIAQRDLTLANAALDRAEQLATTNVTDIAVDRSILIFQAGQHDAALAHARQALTVAKTDADKSQINACIRAIEAGIAKQKNSQTNNVSSTNTPAKPKP